MSVCTAPPAHSYDPDQSVLSNLFRIHEYTEVWGNSSICPTGYLAAADISSLLMVSGAIGGAYLWFRRPRISAALIAGTVVFWAFFQWATWRIGVLQYAVFMDGDYFETRAYSRALADAAIQQAAFEMTFFLLIPIGLVLVARSRRRMRTDENSRLEGAVT